VKDRVLISLFQCTYAPVPPQDPSLDHGDDGDGDEGEEGKGEEGGGGGGALAGGTSAFDLLGVIAGGGAWARASLRLPDPDVASVITLMNPILAKGGVEVARLRQLMEELASIPYMSLGSIKIEWIFRFFHVSWWVGGGGGSAGHHQRSPSSSGINLFDGGWLG
jgi:hypothetical protein